MSTRQRRIEFRKTRDRAEFGALLRLTPTTELAATGINLLSVKLREFPVERDLKLALVGNFTLDFLPAWIDVLAAREGIAVQCYVAPFDQAFQEVLDPASGLRRFEPDATFLVLDSPAPEPIIEWVELALEHLSGELLVANLCRGAHARDGIADLKEEGGETEAHLEANLQLLRAMRPMARAHIVDLERVMLRVGSDRGIDERLRFLARSPWSDRMLVGVAEELLRYLLAIAGRTRKCLVLDLDNTLWGGVAGEDGADGVRVGEGSPAGEAYAAFQRRVLEIGRRGVLLAICSKNNSADAEEVFRRRPEMPLRWEDFAAREIGWEPKHLGLQRIAETLNIGLESLIFIDDSPAECLLVREMLPEVRVICLGDDPSDLATRLDRVCDLEKIRLLDADRGKQQQYVDQATRSEKRASFGDLREYLQHLETKLTIRVADESDLDRAHQLFLKTNQFNVTTIRYGADRVRAFHDGAGHDLLVAAASDRFGELGTIGLMLVERGDGAARIDSFILSCRAMGRGIESALANDLKRRYRDFDRITARYVPTAKNMPAREFFAGQGFRLESEAEDGTREYVLERDASSAAECGWIEVTVEES